VKLPGFSLHAVTPPAQAGKSARHRQIQQDSDVRHDAADRLPAEAVQPPDVKTAAIALIGQRRIMEPVAHNDSAGPQGRRDALFNERHPAANEEQRLSQRRERR
jgi:hypothetical protein